MTKEYVATVGRMAYLWGWPLVNMANRGDSFSKATVPVLLGGVVPVAFGRNAMLTRKRRENSSSTGALFGSRSVFSTTLASFRPATFAALAAFVSFVDPR